VGRERKKKNQMKKNENKDERKKERYKERRKKERYDMCENFGGSMPLECFPVKFLSDLIV
jgi:hypothetical protein